MIKPEEKEIAQYIVTFSSCNLSALQKLVSNEKWVSSLYFSLAENLENVCQCDGPYWGNNSLMYYVPLSQINCQAKTACTTS